MTKINSTTVIVRGESTLRNTNADANICFRAQDGAKLHDVKVRSNPYQYQVTCGGAEYLGCTEHLKPTLEDWRAIQVKKPSGFTNNVMDDTVWYMGKGSFNIDRKKRSVRIGRFDQIQYCSVKTPIVNSEWEKETIYLSGVVTRAKIRCVDTVIITDCRIGTLSLQNVGRVIIGGDTTIARVATRSVRLVSIGEYGASPVHIGKLVVRGALATTIAGDANVASGNINSALTILEGCATLGS
jgi:hypothetical protein